MFIMIQAKPKIDPSLTYPVVTPGGIREVTGSSILRAQPAEQTHDDRIRSLEDQVARQQAMIENMSAAMSRYFPATITPTHRNTL